MLSFFINYLYGIDWSVPKVLMIKESCNLIGQKYILVDNFKVYIDT